MVLVYKANKGIIGGTSDPLNVEVPLYLQQLFHHFVNGISSEDGKMWIIQSQFELLGDALQQELILFPSTSSTCDKVILSPFLRSLCDEQQVIMMTEYIWIIDDDALSELRNINDRKRIHSDSFLFPLLNSENMIFRVCLGRHNNDADTTALSVRIADTPFPVDMRISMICDEAKWITNGHQPKRKDKGAGFAQMAFNGRFIDQMNMLTIRVALHCTKST